MPVVSAERARTIAREWVGNSGGRIPGFRGAFLHGSINWLDAADPNPSTSDVDVIVVYSGPDLPPRPGKFHHKGVLLDVSFLDADELGSPAFVLGNSHLAGSLRGASVVADPSGRLTELQAAVAREYADRKWVIRRCEHAREKVIQFLDGVCETDPLHDQFTSWLFGTSVTTHVLLVAGLRNPTVRKRYLAVRGLLEEYGRLDVQEELLELLGAAHLSRPNVEQHLASMTGAFDAAKTVITTPVFFASDISDVARPIAIDGSREMIESGFHREAVFWIAATYSRCQKVLAADAPPERRDQFTPGFRAMLADLGITSFADMARRRHKVRAYLPRLMAVAEQIIAGNPEIDDNTGM